MGLIFPDFERMYYYPGGPPRHVATPGVQVTAYWLAEDDNDVPDEAYILANGTQFSITDGEDYSITFPNTTPKYWKVFEPSAQPVKTHNDTQFGPDAFGDGGTFGTGVTVGGFRGYIGNYDTLNTTSPTKFNQ